MLKGACFTFQFVADDSSCEFFHVTFADFTSGSWQLQFLRMRVLTTLTAGYELKASNAIVSDVSQISGQIAITI
jgi:hypothetical protein